MMDYHRKYGAKTRIVRLFNVYGPRLNSDDGRVVSNFIHQALTGKDITIYGDGSQTRSFQYVSDAVAGIKSLMNSDCCTPVNIGNPNEFTIMELAQRIIKLTNSGSQLVFEKLPQDDPTQRKPDISKAKKVLGWEPKVELVDGLKKTIQFFKENL